MTTTYDPHHPAYLDEADVRAELTRVYDLCHGCRLCFKFCSAFPTLFDFVDRHDDQDAARLTPAQQDQVVDECFGCKLCDVNCPYTPAKGHEWALDFPRLMLRTQAMRHATGQLDRRDRLTTAVMGRTDQLGRVGSAAAPLVNAVVAAPGGSLVRRAVQAVTGVSATRLLAPYARTRFSTWFRRRSAAAIPAAAVQGSVTVFPTCVVEYQKPEIGHDLVKVYERNRIRCSLADGAGCCGAPFLHAGDVDSFTRTAEANVAALAAAVRAGNDIVVPQPTCSFVLRKDYPDYVGGPDAELVAGHTYDAAEYLMKVHRADGTSLDTEFTGQVPAAVTYHTACHLRAQNIGLRSRDLLRLTGAKVTLVQQCSGIDGMWGLRAGNEELSLGVGRKLAAAVDAAEVKAGAGAGAEAVVAGDCSLANGVITEQTGRVALHPLQVVARAYGIPAEGDRR